MMSKTFIPFIKTQSLRLLTIVVWMVFVVSLLWIVISIGWVILAKFIFEDMYIPSSIAFTLTISLIVFGWVLVVAFIFSLLNKKSKNQNTYETYHDHALTSFDNTSFHWSEIIYHNSKSQDSYTLKQKLLTYNELEQMSPDKLLSYGITLENKNMIKEALGIYRMVIGHPDSIKLLIEVSQHRLYHILSCSGKTAGIIARKIKEESLYDESN